LDLSLLLGGKHFTFPCTVSFNGFAISTYSLIDTGANGFIFLDEKFARLLSCKLGWKLEKLPFPSLPIKGYDGRRGPSITSFLRTHLTLDGRRIYNVPFLVLPLGSHDIIIGKTFLEYFDISPSVAKKKLHWPPNHPKTTRAISQGTNIPRQILQRPLIQGAHQQDMEIRDKLIEWDEQRRLAGNNTVAHIHPIRPVYTDGTTQTDEPTAETTRLLPKERLDLPGAKAQSREEVTPPPGPPNPQESNDPPQSLIHLPVAKLHRNTRPTPLERKPQTDLARHTYQLDHQDRLQQMKLELADSFGTTPSTQEPRKVTFEEGPLYSLESPYLAICEISAAAFQLSTRRRDHEVFTTSLYEIDRLLEDADPLRASPDPLEEQRLAQVSRCRLEGRVQQITTPPILRPPDRARKRCFDLRP
jgi:hypothetical protein